MFQHARLRSGDGPFYSEKDAAVGRTDCMTMLKLVPFVCATDAGLESVSQHVGLADRSALETKRHPSLLVSF